MFYAESHWWIMSGSSVLTLRQVLSSDVAVYQKWTDSFGKKRGGGGGGLVTEYFQTSNEDGCEDTVSSLTL